jgi:Mg-chelatase subunit ChlD
MIGIGSLFGQQVALREPRVLIVAALVIALALLLWLWRGRRVVPKRAVVLRTLAFIALAVALAGPLLARPTPAGATVFVIDRSRSMGDDDLRLLSEQIAAALASRKEDEPVGLVAFAERAAVVYPVGGLTATTTRESIASTLAATDVGSRDFTDVVGALRLSESLPAAGGRRLVLFSDGRQTLGEATDWAAGAAGRGIVIDALSPASRRLPGDVRITDLRAPQSTWQGDDVEIEAVLAGDAAGDVSVQLIVDGRVTGRQTVKLSAGTTGANGTARFVLQPLAPGYHSFQVETTTTAGDPITENNTLAATTVVRDKPNVLIVEGTRGNANNLRNALTRTTFDVTVRDPAGLTERLPDLAAFDAIVLADVPATALSYEKQKALQEYVRSSGKGLIVTGGGQSFGKGGYEGSTLEEALPVRVKPRAEGKRPPAALLLIVDSSGSMDTPRGGPTRIDMAKSAAASAVRALSPGDEIAVLTFNDGNLWVQRLRKINDNNDITAVVDQISKIKSEGVTEMYGAIVAGVEELKTSQLGTKHIILLSDGEPTTRFDPDEAARRARASDMTLSTIAIGQSADFSLMERLAQGGGGRYSYAQNPQDIPKLTLEETEQLAGKTTATGDFRAVQTAPSPILRGLDPATLPTIGGYQITEAKPDAQAILQSGREEPVLAQWQYGLGRVVTWTSDLNQDLAPNWRDSQAFTPFWNQAVRWTLAAAISPSYRVAATPDGRDIVLNVDAFDGSGQPIDLTQTTARLRTPSGQAVELALPQSAPGRYTVRLAAPEAGAYSLELRQSRDGQAVTDTVGFSVPYPAELRGPTVGDSILGALADRTGGQVLANAGQVFSRTVMTATPSFRSVWQPFAIAALLLFLLDTAIRLGYAATSGRNLRRIMPR